MCLSNCILGIQRGKERELIMAVHLVVCLPYLFICTPQMLALCSDDNANWQLFLVHAWEIMNCTLFKNRIVDDDDDDVILMKSVAMFIQRCLVVLCTCIWCSKNWSQFLLRGNFFKNLSFQSNYWILFCYDIFPSPLSVLISYCD